MAISWSLLPLQATPTLLDPPLDELPLVGLGAGSEELLAGVHVVEGASVEVGSADEVHSVVETSVEVASTEEEEDQLVDEATSVLVPLPLSRVLQRFVRARFAFGLATRLESPSCAARRFR